MVSISQLRFPPGVPILPSGPRSSFITVFLWSQFALLTYNDLSFFSSTADPISSSEPYYILGDIIYVFLLTPHDVLWAVPFPRKDQKAKALHCLR